MEKEMRSLISQLKEASWKYYNGEEIMSNKEYDEKYDRLVELEKETGIIYPDSPTQNVGAAVDSLEKVAHEYPAKSLAKTKDVSEIVRFYNENKNDSDDVIVMFKLDGSTVVLTYDNGVLVRAATRGNGEIGSDITHNAPYIKGIPMEIPTKGHLVVRGEALMSYSEFERINSVLPAEEQYKNPRNLANATINMLDSNEMKRREIKFRAFDLVHANLMPFTRSDCFMLLNDYGFECVDFIKSTITEIPTAVKTMTDRVSLYDFPVDGLVIAYEDWLYASRLPESNHNPNRMFGFALKWEDETVETTLRKIEWSPSRTGLLNPVAVFDPVELEGTTVTRATLHNVSYVLDKNLQEGDTITVYKANKIIPAVDKNLSYSKHPLIEKVDVYCPCCGEKADFTQLPNQRSVAAYCPNQNCSAKMIGKLVHFCDRDCMNIKGMGESMATTLVLNGVNNLGNLYYLADLYNDKGYNVFSAEMGIGELTSENLIEEIEKSKNVSFVNLIHAFGIENVGYGQAKLLKKAVEKYHKDSPEEEDYIHCLARMVWEEFDFTTIEGFGEVIANSITRWVDNNLCDPWGRYISETDASYICDTVTVVDEWPKEEKKGSLDGLVFVITGDVNHYKNRAELQAEIENLGGKVSGSVSKNTNYLINNDINSTSGKNQKAKELGVKIITEDEYIDLKEA